jgi:hypothetical protein
MNLHAPSRRFTSIYVPFAFPAAMNIHRPAEHYAATRVSRNPLRTRAKREERKNTMRKSTMLAVVLVLVVGVLAAVVPALRLAGHRCSGGASGMACHLGSDGGSCDVVSALRGGIRLTNSELCQADPVPVQCTVTGVAGLERK